jgi:hypothetical protein
MRGIGCADGCKLDLRRHGLKRTAEEIVIIPLLRIDEKSHRIIPKANAKTPA